MVYNVRQLSDSDYDEILVGWWKDWRWPSPPPKDFLPNNGTSGIIVFDGETPVCAGFLYHTNSNVAWINWIVSNFQYKDRDKRKEALSLLIDTLTNAAKNMGCKYAYSLTNNKHLTGVYNGIGYVNGDVYNNEMIKTL